MQHVRRIVETHQTAVDDDDDLVTQRVDRSADTRLTAANAVWYIFGLIAVLLAARFILKIAGANPGNEFVNFIYSASGIFSAPFDSAFGVATVDAGAITSQFEPSILVAMLVYLLIAWGITRLLTLNDRTTTV